MCKQILQVYLDDSGKLDQSSVVVIAGYISTLEKWKLFSTQWSKILSAHNLSSFRMAQAWRLHRKYYKAGPIKRDWLLVRLLDCIKQHTEQAFVVSLDIDAHAEMFEGWEELGGSFKNLNRAYFGAFAAILGVVYGYNYLYRYDCEFEVILDEQGGESKNFLLSTISNFKEIARQEFPGVQINAPTFRSDDDCPPIQAADMLAWLVRREKYKIDKDEYSELELLLLNEAVSMGVQKNIIGRDKMIGISESVKKNLIDELGDF